MAEAPAKLILSGEHAVVYGAPALAMALPRYTNVTICGRNDEKIVFDYRNTIYRVSKPECVLNYNVSAINNIRAIIDNRYAQFLAGKLPMREVLPDTSSLTRYAVAYFAEQIVGDAKDLPGMEMAITSDIPIGSGMGSSAALLVSLLRALLDFLGITISLPRQFELTRHVENLQHGISSGLDLYVALYGGVVRFQNGAGEPRKSLELPYCLVNTGRPESNTGECVAAAQKHFGSYPPPTFILARKIENCKYRDFGLLADFTAITNALDLALTDNDFVEAKRCIRENHRLLQTLGVVPDKVTSFIAELEKMGLAAKICGAGAVYGDNAGIILVLGAADINKLISQYSYRLA